jgi:hypothetical protein
MSTKWLVGQTARLTANIADSDGQAIDPAALRLKVQPPAGAMIAYIWGVDAEVIRDALGRFHADIVLDASGHWHWRWESDAPPAAAAEGCLVVAGSRFVQEN